MLRSAKTAKKSQMHRKITMNYKDKVANYGYVNMQKSAGRQFSLTSAQPSVHITVYACH